MLRTLTDRGKEYCGGQTHAYELYCELNDIGHSKTKVRSPQTNGSTEKLNQTINEEFYKVAFRRKLYTTIDDLQEDLDTFMNYYNKERTNQGKRCKGRTPYETFTEGVEKYKELVYEKKEEKFLKLPSQNEGQFLINFDNKSLN